jgi:hypothetical protein
MKVFDVLNEAARQWRLEADRWRRRQAASGGPSPDTMLALIRPSLGASTPPNIRRWVEPLVATSAVLALMSLGALGIISFALFLLAGALIYAILTKVFGLELGIEMPNSNL